MPIVWILTGVALGVLLMLPLVRLLPRRAELRAREAERRARQSERLAELGSMTGGLAHEIKNPLSTVSLNAQLLAEQIQDADLPEEQRERLDRRLGALSREVDRLRGILTDFLQFAGRMKLDPRPADVVTVITELRDFFHPQCDTHGVVLRTQLPDRPVPVVMDVDLIKQALLNLMLNAVDAMAHEPPGGDERGRELILRVEASDDTHDDVCIHVIDTGPGIPSDQIARIFHPYVTHKSRGTGLGLPTARRIVEEHGGRLTAHSAPGRGSDFAVHLPRGPVADADAT